MSQDANLRKSSRQPVPNPIYYQSITQLKKESSNKNKKKGKSPEDDYYSHQDSQRYQNPIQNQSQYSVPDCYEPYLLCVLPDGNRRKVQFVCQGVEEQLQQQPLPPPAPKKQVKIIPKPQPKKTTQAPSLLDMFQQAINNPDIVGGWQGEDNQNQRNNNTVEIPSPKIQPPPKKQKKIREKSQGHIKELKITEDCTQIQINHSTLGRISMPLEWKKPEIVKMMPSEQDMQLERKVLEFKGFENLSIFSQ